jgi:hypothetical protein
MIRTHLSFAAVVVTALAACTPSARLQAPDGFATLTDQTEYVYRATSAGGVVLGVRKEPNKPSGNLAFWADIVDRQLRRSGYTADGEASPVHTRAGLVGREMRYTHESNGRPYRFWTAVFVTESTIYIVEAGGDRDRVKPTIAEGIEKAIGSLTLG